MTAFGWAAGYLPDRRELVPPKRPYTALGRTSANGGAGCGVLIGPDLFLTCSHCIADSNRKLYRDAEVEMGLGFYPQIHRAKITDVIMRTGNNLNPDSGSDWALARLDRPLGYYYGWLDCKVVDRNDWLKTPVELLGYCECPDEARPEFGRLDKPYRCPGQVRDLGPSILFHDCSMWGGTSGAPLVVASPEGYQVVALNFGGVDSDGEKMKNGFRAEYVKNLANLAIPAENWIGSLKPLKTNLRPGLRTVWIRNRSTAPIRIVARFKSVFSDPTGPLIESKMVEIPWQKRVCILRPDDGCVESELFLSLTNTKGEVIGPPQKIEVEKDGSVRYFFRKSLGEALDYTATLP